MGAASTVRYGPQGLPMKQPQDCGGRFDSGLGHR